LSLDYATKAEGASPILLVTYDLTSDKRNKAASRPTLKASLNYTVTEEGQKVPTDAGYAPPPAEIDAKVPTIVPTLA
ncbi:phosphate-binding protein, partial [Streptomyces sp. NRRL F-6492]